MPTRQSTMGGGGGNAMMLNFPPFTRAVKWIIGINAVLFFMHGLAGLIGAAWFAHGMERFLLLVPALAVHGWVWQVATYSFANFGMLQLVFGMLIVWMLGSNLESTFGIRWFLRYYAICALGGALGTIGLAYSGLVRGAPQEGMGGVSSIYLGMLIAYGVLFADMEFMLFPLPIQMKAKYLAGLTILISILIAVTGPAGLLGLGQLGGLIAGFVYVKFFHGGGSRRPVAYGGRGLSDRGFAPAHKRSVGLFTRMKNAYYKWKR